MSEPCTEALGKIGAPLNRASDPQVQRQPGSTFKPIAIYGPAINERRITAATIVDDVPVYMLGVDKGAYPTILTTHTPDLPPSATP